MVALHRDDDDRRPDRPRLRLVERPLPRVRADALPEYTDYRDTGCELSASCLACPLERCQYDDAAGGGRPRPPEAQRRDREIVLLRRKYGAPIDRLAQTYGVSRRTVFRILREAREGLGAGG